jgi:uncharacterized protein (DUF342 family)
MFTIKTGIFCLANECMKFKINKILTNNRVFPKVCIYIRKVTSMVKYSHRSVTVSFSDYSFILNRSNDLGK